MFIKSCSELMGATSVPANVHTGEWQWPSV